MWVDAVVAAVEVDAVGVVVIIVAVVVVVVSPRPPPMLSERMTVLCVLSEFVGKRSSDELSASSIVHG